MAGLEVLMSSDEIEGQRHTCSLSTDKNGHLVYVGLTVEESIWLYNHRKNSVLRRARTKEDSVRSKALREKHEAVRLAVLGAEVDIKNNNPTSH